MSGAKVLGVDSSTQSCKAVLCDAESGAVLATGRADHPTDVDVDPRAWLAAFERASAGLGERADAVAVGGQQHGMVALDDSDAVVRPALLWNDMRSAADSADLVAELGAEQWAQQVGSVPTASFTVTKLRWLARCEADNAARTARVLLPHDWLTAQLAGLRGDHTVTDAGDASGTGYFSPSTRTYRPDLAHRALGHLPGAPRVAGPGEPVGNTAGGAVVGPGTGDNMAAALGLGIGPGDVVLSLGTSGTVFAVSDVPTADPTGEVAGFADATGRFLPLVCTLNAARVLTSTAAMLGVDLAGLDRLALQAGIGADGVTLLPYLDGERTPNLPDATGSLHGLTRASMTPQTIARAAVEGMVCGLADGLDALQHARTAAAGAGEPDSAAIRRVLVIGGAAASRAVQAVVATLFAAPVVVPAPGEYVALGAARQAAAALAGRNPADLPPWPVPAEPLPEPSETDLRRGREVRERYAAIRRATHAV